MASHGDAGGEAACFERSGGIEAFVLDVDVGIFAAEQHGSEAFAERDGIGVGKDGVIAPHGGRASGEARGREGALDRGEIVARVEDAGIFGTDRLRTVGGIVFAAAGAFEVSQHADAEFSIGRGSQFSVLSSQFSVLSLSRIGSSELRPLVSDWLSSLLLCPPSRT